MTAIPADQVSSGARDGWSIRIATPADERVAGELLADTYVTAGLATPGDSYVPELRDVAGRVADPHADVLVAVSAGVDGTVIGTVTRCGHGSGSTVICSEHEFEFRMLAVDPAWRGHGVAAALVNACDYFGARRGQTVSLGCAWEENHAAKRLYTKIGFDHDSHRDWFYSPEEFLFVYSRPVANCPLCGESLPETGHPNCQRALHLEPPRYCANCGRRLKVQVSPNGWAATCARHGTIVG